MEYIRKILKNEATNLNENEIKIFKESIEGMFNNLIDNFSQKMKEVEVSIENSFKNAKNTFWIYSTVINKNEINYYKDILNPIIGEEKEYYDYSIIQKKIIEQESVIIDKLFFENDPFKIVDENKIFFGKIITEDKEYDISLKLKRFIEYKEEIKKLYTYSRNNFYSWHTPNIPCINSFYELEIINLGYDLNELKDIIDIKYNLEQLEGEYRKNLCLVWNIEKIEKLNSQESILCGKNNYKYKTGFLSKDKVILINENYEILSLNYDEENILELISDNESIRFFNYYIVNKVDEFTLRENSLYPFWHNKIKDDFVNDFKTFYGQRIRSVGEIKRLINLIIWAKGFILEDVKVIKRTDYNENIITKNINDYIISDIRKDAKTELLVLSFYRNEKILFEVEVLSYLVSEIQDLFPEYECIGELL